MLTTRCASPVQRWLVVATCFASLLIVATAAAGGVHTQTASLTLSSSVTTSHSEDDHSKSTTLSEAMSRTGWSDTLTATPPTLSRTVSDFPTASRSTTVSASASETRSPSRGTQTGTPTPTLTSTYTRTGSLSNMATHSLRSVTLSRADSRSVSTTSSDTPSRSPSKTSSQSHLTTQPSASITLTGYHSRSRLSASLTLSYVFSGTDSATASLTISGTPTGQLSDSVTPSRSLSRSPSESQSVSAMASPTPTTSSEGSATAVSLTAVASASRSATRTASHTASLSSSSEASSTLQSQSVSVTKSLTSSPSHSSETSVSSTRRTLTLFRGARKTATPKNSKSGSPSQSEVRRSASESVTVSRAHSRTTSHSNSFSVSPVGTQSRSLPTRTLSLTGQQRSMSLTLVTHGTETLFSSSRSVTRLTVSASPIRSRTLSASRTAHSPSLMPTASSSPSTQGTATDSLNPRVSATAEVAQTKSMTRSPTSVASATKSASLSRSPRTHSDAQSASNTDSAVSSQTDTNSSSISRTLTQSGVASATRTNSSTPSLSVGTVTFGNRTRSNSTQQSRTETASRSHTYSEFHSLSRSMSTSPSAGYRSLTRTLTESPLTPSRALTRRSHTVSMSSLASVSPSPSLSRTVSRRTQQRSSTSTQTPEASKSLRSPSISRSASPTDSRTPVPTITHSPTAVQSLTLDTATSSDSHSLTQAGSYTRSSSLKATTTIHRKGRSSTRNTSRSKSVPTMSHSATPVRSVSISMSPTDLPTNSYGRTLSSMNTVTSTLVPSSEQTSSRSSSLVFSITGRLSASNSSTASASEPTLTAMLSEQHTVSSTPASSTKSKQSRSPSVRTRTASTQVSETRTFSVTTTLSVSGTETVSVSESMSGIASWTLSETQTLTLSPSRSTTVSQSLSPSPSPSELESASTSRSPTLSRSSTATLSESRSSEESPTKTASGTSTKRRLNASPTASRSPETSPSMSPSKTPMKTVTVTYTKMRSWSPTESVSRTHSLTPEVASMSSSLGPSATVAGSKSSTLLSSVSVLETQTTTLTGVVTESKTQPTMSSSPTAVQSSSGSVTSSQTHSRSPSPLQSNSVTVTAVYTATVSRSQQRSKSRAPPTPTTSQGATHTHTLVLTPSRPSPTLSATLSLTVTVSLSRVASRSRSITRASPTATTTAVYTTTETLVESPSDSPTNERSMVKTISHTASLSPRTRTAALPKSGSLPLSLEATQSDSTSVSASKSAQSTTTETVSAASPSRTPAVTQTLMFTADATTSLTFIKTATHVRGQSKSSTTSITLTITLTRAQSASATRSAATSGTVTATKTSAMSVSPAALSRSKSLSAMRTVSSSSSYALPSVSRTFSLSRSRSVDRRVSITLVDTKTVLLTPDQTGSKSLSLTRERSRSSSPSRTHTETPTSSPSDTMSSFSTATRTVQRSRGLSAPLTPSKISPTVSRTLSDLVTRTISLNETDTSTGTSDVTLTESPTLSNTRYTPSLSYSDTSRASRSRSYSDTIPSFIRATAAIDAPAIPVVRQLFQLSLNNVPSSIQPMSDVAFIVRHNDSANDTATFNRCGSATLPASVAAATAVRLSIDSVRTNNTVLSRTRNMTTLLATLSGMATAVGQYDLCYYSAARKQWTWWNLGLFIGPNVRPIEYLRPRGRLEVSTALRLTVGVFGALPTDHMVIVLRSLRNASQPGVCPGVSSPTQSGRVSEAAWFIAGPSVTNATFSATGTVLEAGDYVLCYFGFPYTRYRLVFPLVRIAGSIQSMSSLQIGSTVTAYYPFVFSIAGVGLGTYDPVLVANGTRCDHERLSPSVVVHSVVTKAGPRATFTSVQHRLQILAPYDQIVVCSRSNFSSYFVPLRTLRVLDNGAAAVSPSDDTATNGVLSYARGTTVVLRSVTPVLNGTLDPSTDMVGLCAGRTVDCSCLAAADGGGDAATAPYVQRFVWTNRGGGMGAGAGGPLGLWNLPQVRLSPAADVTPAADEELWSLCYLTNASRPWRIEPLSTIRILRFPNVPVTLPYTAVTASVTLTLVNFNWTIANSVYRTFPLGTSPSSCGTSAVSGVVPQTADSTLARLTVSTQAPGNASRPLITVVPLAVQPMELCVHNNYTNDTVVSSAIFVVPMVPSSYSPTRFVANVSTVVSFLPSDASAFNFVATAATVVLCPNVSETRYVSLVVDRVINATVLALRFTNLTSSSVASGALCLLNPSNGTALPIPQTAAFVVTSQLQTASFSTSGALRNVALVVNTALTASNVTITPSTASVPIRLVGISLYPGDPVLQACSSAPSVLFSLTSASVSTVTEQGTGLRLDVVTTIWAASSTVAGNFSVCIRYGNGKLLDTSVPVVEGVQSSSSSPPMQLVFDSLLSGVQQLPAVPHAAILDHANAYWLVAPTALDSSFRFSAVRMVQLVPGFDDICANPVAISLVVLSSTSQLTWKYRASDTAFARGNVTLCYQSYSSNWYAFSSSASTFFMQAVLVPSTFSFRDSQSSNTTTSYATCSTTVFFSGYQIDGALDSFYFYFMPPTFQPSPASLSSIVCQDSVEKTPLSISAIARDSSSRARLVNVTATLVGNQTGTIVVCGKLSQSALSVPSVNPTRLGTILVANPVLVTATQAQQSSTPGSNAGATSSLISLRCVSASVLAAPAAVAYNFSVRLAGSSAFMPLDASTSVSQYTIVDSPLSAFEVRYTAFLALSPAQVLATFDSAPVPSTVPKKTTTTAALVYCADVNVTRISASATNRAKAFVFARYVLAMSNFVLADCGAYLEDGTIAANHSAVEAYEGALALLQSDVTLLWDSAFLYPLMTQVYTSSLKSSAPLSSGATVEETTTALLQLMLLVDPATELAAPGANATAVVTNYLALLQPVANFLSAAGSGTSAATLAPVVMSRLSTLATGACTAAKQSPAASSSFGDDTSTSILLTSTKPATATATSTLNLGTQVGVVVPRSGGSMVPNSCVSAVSMPNILPDAVPAGSTASSSRRLFQSSSSTTSALLPFNLSTVVIFSDALISSAQVTYYRRGQSRVDFVSSFQFLQANASQPNFTSVVGGRWYDRGTGFPFEFSAATQQLRIDFTASAATATTYLVYSGVATSVFPDVILLKREAAADRVKVTIYYALLAVIAVHVLSVVGSVLLDRWWAAKRYRETKELLFGIPSPIPSWVQLHRYLCLRSVNPISLTRSEYLKIRNETALPQAPNGQNVNDDELLTLHPLAEVSTVAKVNAMAMYWYCLLLTTAVVNRQGVAEQVPVLFAEFVLLGGCSAVLARPLSTWTRVVLMRQSQDLASIVVALVAIIATVVAGAAGQMTMRSVMVVMVVSGIVSLVVGLALLHWRGAGPAPAVLEVQKSRPDRRSPAPPPPAARMRWSLHHLIQVPLPLQWISTSLFLTAFALCAALLFFVPYFSGKQVIFGYTFSSSTTFSAATFPFFGSGDPYTLSDAATYVPDASIFWKSFVLALTLDAAVIETAASCFFVLWMQSVLWWRVTRHMGLSAQEQLLSLGSGKRLQGVRDAASIMRGAPTASRHTPSQRPYGDDMEPGGFGIEEVSQHDDSGDDSRFVDVFSGSPAQTPANWSAHRRYQGKSGNDDFDDYDFGGGGDASTSKRSKHVVSPSWVRGASGSSAKPTTTFRTEPFSGGLIEEVAEMDVDSSLDRTFASIAVDEMNDSERPGASSNAATPFDPFSHAPFDDSDVVELAAAQELQRRERERVDRRPFSRAPTSLPRAPVAVAAHQGPDNPLTEERVWEWRDPRPSVSLSERRNFPLQQQRLHLGSAGVANERDAGVSPMSPPPRSTSRRHRRDGMNLSSAQRQSMDGDAFGDEAMSVS